MVVGTGCLKAVALQWALHCTRHKGLEHEILGRMKAGGVEPTQTLESGQNGGEVQTGMARCSVCIVVPHTIVACSEKERARSHFVYGANSCWLILRFIHVALDFAGCCSFALASNSK